MDTITIQRTVVTKYTFHTLVKEMRTLLALYNSINSTQSPAWGTDILTSLVWRKR